MLWRYLNPFAAPSAPAAQPPTEPCAADPPRAPFDQLYRDHVDRIYRYAHRLCGEPEAAKDIVQDTFLNAYRAFERFRGDAQVSTWLYTIASHACTRMRRRRKGEPQQSQCLSLESFAPMTDGELRLQIPVEGLSPHEALENKELRQALDQAIGKLPPPYRKVLILRDMEGLSAKEVGTIMRLQERAVKSRLHRARLFVRRELSAKGMGAPLDAHAHDAEGRPVHTAASSTAVKGQLA